jgi:hypothetical protein
MLEPLTNHEPVVYQLRVVLRRISPLIWRRLLVRSDATIADLQATLHIALGWSYEHLNRFVIHSREYGLSHIGRIGFRDDPRQVRLADLGLRVRERCLYEYGFTDGWQHDVRLEQILQSNRIAPTRCASVVAAMCRPRTAAGPGRSWSCASATRPSTLPSGWSNCSGQPRPRLTMRASPGDHYEELVYLLRWLKIDRFERRAANRQLARLAMSSSELPA